MAILEQDIKLLASQVMADVPEGGGAPTGVEIVDGVSNNLFPDVSELDRTVGNVSLRKVHVGIRTATTDGYFGAHAIVADAPDDANVSAVLFSTGETFDTRTQAQSRIEAYLAQGATYGGILFGDHIAGMRTITMLQRAEIPVPTVGTTMMLTANVGSVNATNQYVRATDVTSRERTFTVPGTTNGDTFKRTEVTLQISDPLRTDFLGFQPADSFRDSEINFTGKTKIFETIVADAARYFGIVPLASAGAIGDFTVLAEGIHTQLVPSAQVETPLADARMNQQSAALVASGDTATLQLTLNWSPTQNMFIGGGILPGSLTIVRDAITLTDAGGKLKNGTQEVGSVDYENGIAILSAIVWGSGGTHTVTYTPASAPTVVTRSIGVPVTQQSQSLTQVITLDPVPAKASLQVSYLAGGRWYVLADDGSGAIRGSASALGAGTLNFTTGTVTMTFGALPDVGSSVIYSWSPTASQSAVKSTAQFEIGGRAHVSINLATPIKPGSLVVSWNDGGPRTATDLNGALQGDATGIVYYGLGSITLSPNTLPAPGTVLTVDITETAQQAPTFGPLTNGGSTWGLTLTTPIKPYSVQLAVATSIPMRNNTGSEAPEVGLRQVFDDGLGGLFVVQDSGNLTIGSINYATGAVTLNKVNAGFQSVQGIWVNRKPTGGANDPAYLTFTGTEVRTVDLTILADTTTLPPAGQVPGWAWWTTYTGEAAWARYAGGDTVASTHTYTINALKIVVRPSNFSANYAPDFRIGPDRYVCRANIVQRNPNPTTGEGTPCGIVQGYTVGFSQWTAGSSPIMGSISGTRSASSFQANPDLNIDGAIFRTASAPLKPASFSVVGTKSDGTQFNATAGLDGVINSGGVVGIVDVATGVVTLRFGIPAAAPANPAAPEPGRINVSSLGIPGLTWLQSTPVQADTLRYNAVSYAYIPLDAAILGLDPVRLPPDGRVPIFRAGSVAVIHHTKRSGSMTVSNGQTINLARTRLARVRVIGSNGQTITAGYTVNLDAGTVTFVDVAAYSQPIQIEDRIEDTALVAEAQITGSLRVTRPLTHDFPVPGSFVSSSLLIGNMQARVSSVFDNAAWDNVWSDDPTPPAAAGTFDHINFPITTSNLGAVTERWAVQFTGSTAFRVFGEHVGLVGTGNTSTDFAPVNPASGTPYFNIPAAGWGGGWATGNAVRINTVGAMAPIWCARVIKQGPATAPNDSFSLLVRGDIDTP